MKNLFFIGIFTILFICCNNSAANKLIGKWKVIAITPTDTASYNSKAGLAAIVWLNILSSNSIFEFKDSVYNIGNNFTGKYNITNQH